MNWTATALIGCCLVLLFNACGSETPPSPPPASPTTVQTAEEAVAFFGNKGTTPQLAFTALLDSSYYQQPDSFVQALRQQFQLPTEFTVLQVQHQALYGLSDSVWWIEIMIPTASDTTCPYPSQRQQLLFDHKGLLLHRSNGEAAQFLSNALDSLPLYIEVAHNCRGESQHSVYRYQEGTFINLLNPLLETTPTTYDILEDTTVFQGGSLQPRVLDVNKDGYSDLVLEGTCLQLYSARGQRYSPKRPYRRVRVQYTFLYEPAKEYFIYQEL